VTARSLLAVQPVPLTDAHDLSSFRCAETEIAEYLITEARAAAALGLCVPYVACAPGTNQVIGFVGLSACSQSATMPISGKPRGTYKPLLPGELGRAKYPVPMILLAQLGTHSDWEGRKIGTQLMLFAITKAIVVSEQIGAAGIVLDALRPALFDFYARFKFIDLKIPGRRRMLLTMAEARASLAAVRS
jgi:GNAT superfamily N-acetyltransferase